MDVCNLHWLQRFLGLLQRDLVVPAKRERIIDADNESLGVVDRGEGGREGRGAQSIREAAARAGMGRGAVRVEARKFWRVLEARVVG